MSEGSILTIKQNIRWPTPPENTTLFVVCHACIRVEAVSSIKHIFCDERHALEAFFQPKITRERDRIENLFNLWITQVPVHRGGGAHVDGGDDWESRERLGRRWGGWWGGRRRQPMECASFGLKTNKKTLNDQICFWYEWLRGRNSNIFPVLKAILCYKPN